MTRAGAGRPDRPCPQQLQITGTDVHNVVMLSVHNLVILTVHKVMTLHTPELQYQSTPFGTYVVSS